MNSGSKQDHVTEVALSMPQHVVSSNIAHLASTSRQEHKGSGKYLRLLPYKGLITWEAGLQRGYRGNKAMVTRGGTSKAVLA